MDTRPNSARPLTIDQLQALIYDAGRAAVRELHRERHNAEAHDRALYPSGARSTTGSTKQGDPNQGDNQK